MIIHAVTKYFRLGLNDPTDSITNMMEALNTEQKCREYGKFGYSKDARFEIRKFPSLRSFMPNDV